MEATLSPGRRRAAWAVALTADALQLALVPLFGEGFASPFDDVLDLAVAGILWRLLGFHWALLPAALAEALPVVDLAPTWSATVLLIAGAPGGPWVKRALLGAAVVSLVVLAALFFRRR